MRTFSIIFSNYTMQLFAWEGTPKACKKFLGNREVIGTIEAQSGTDAHDLWRSQKRLAQK